MARKLRTSAPFFLDREIHKIKELLFCFLCISQWSEVNKSERMLVHSQTGRYPILDYDQINLLKRSDFFSPLPPDFLKVSFFVSPPNAMHIYVTTHLTDHKGGRKRRKRDMFLSLSLKRA